MTQAPHPKRVLVTGAAGAIGQIVCAHLLRRGHHVRGFDRNPLPDLADRVVAELRDRAAILAAVDGMETVIHFAAYRNDADFADVLLEPNVLGLFHVCDAARRGSVRRLVLASTAQTVNGWGRETEPIRVADGARPTNHYALTKIWAETMGEMYARCYDLSVINVRLGWLPRDAAFAQRVQQSERGVDIFLSHDDAGRFFARCVESEQPAAGEAVTVFATSKPLRNQRLDLSPARELLDYVPQDTWPQGLPFGVG